MTASRTHQTGNAPAARTKRSVRRPERSVRAHGMTGFTLVELMVTVAIAAILLSLATPSFTTMLNKNRVASLTNELSGALQAARSQAVTRGKTVTVCKSANATAATPTCSTSSTVHWQDGWLIFVDANQNNSFSTGDSDELLKIGQPTSGNAITPGTDFTDYISYFPAGTSSAAGDETDRTFTICLPPEERSIVVSRIGQIRIVPGTCL